MNKLARKAFLGEFRRLEFEKKNTRRRLLLSRYPAIHLGHGFLIPDQVP